VILWNKGLEKKFREEIEVCSGNPCEEKASKELLNK
jgi:hypothetical protein